MFPVKNPATNLEIAYEIPNFYNIFYGENNQNHKIGKYNYNYFAAS
jgi:hypothetical protein